jgi:hypothetical protein
MSEFTKTPATKRSLSIRKLLYGKGINDAKYKTVIKSNDKTIWCPIYQKWVNMIKRCYCEKAVSKNKTYDGCTVCDEWLLFSNFSAWYELNYIDGYDLDKDLKYKGNKVYSTGTCLFIPSTLNKPGFLLA